MKYLSYLLLIFASLPLAASDAKLYQRLQAFPLAEKHFVATRTSTGVDFSSKEEILIGGRNHPKFHIEVEGPLPAGGATSLQSAVELIAQVVGSEVDRDHKEENTIYPGLGVDIVDVNGVHVAFLKYRSSREPETFLQRGVIFASGKIYTVTMSLHSVEENDRMGIYLPMLIIEMVNSEEIAGLRT